MRSRCLPGTPTFAGTLLSATHRWSAIAPSQLRHRARHRSTRSGLDLPQFKSIPSTHGLTSSAASARWTPSFAANWMIRLPFTRRVRWRVAAATGLARASGLLSNSVGAVDGRRSTRSKVPRSVEFVVNSASRAMAERENSLALRSERREGRG